LLELSQLPPEFPLPADGNGMSNSSE